MTLFGWHIGRAYPMMHPGEAAEIYRLGVEVGKKQTATAILDQMDAFDAQRGGTSPRRPRTSRPHPHLRLVGGAA